jgi:type II secretory pathway component PulF
MAMDNQGAIASATLAKIAVRGTLTFVIPTFETALNRAPLRHITRLLVMLTDGFIKALDR